MELDSLLADIPHYERKREDMQKKLDRLYDKLEKQEGFLRELHGVSVHTSHIVEVKRKCGLDMRKNYNVSKKNAPKKPCTKEKEAYIKEALRHFGMI